MSYRRRVADDYPFATITDVEANAEELERVIDQTIADIRYHSANPETLTELSQQLQRFAEILGDTDWTE